MNLRLLILRTLAFILSFEIQKNRLHVVEAVEINSKDINISRNARMSEIYSLLQRFRKHTSGYNRQRRRKKLFKNAKRTPRLTTKPTTNKLHERAAANSNSNNPLLGRAITLGTGSYRRRRGNRGSARNPTPPPMATTPISTPMATPPTSPTPPPAPLTYRFEKVGQRICGTQNEGMFGWIINISSQGKRLAIGSESGLVQVYEQQLGKWNQIGQDINGRYVNEEAQFKFVSLSSDGNYLGVVRDVYEAITYTFVGSDWSPVGSYSDGQKSINEIRLSDDGSRIALSKNEDTVELFASGDDDTPIAEVTWSDQIGSIMSELSGDGKRLAVYYSEVDEIRVYTDEMTMVGSPIVTSDVDFIILSVSLSYEGDTLALSGVNYAARVFEYDSDGDAWKQKGTDFASLPNDSDNAAADDYSYVYTFSSMTDAGDRIVVSDALVEVSSATGSYSGRVVIHDFYGGAWNRIGSLLNTFASVDISPDGGYFAIGSFLKSTGELTENGCVTVFQIIQN